MEPFGLIPPVTAMAAWEAIGSDMSPDLKGSF